MASIPDIDIVAIEAEAEIRQVKTMADHSLNVILNFPEPYKEQAKKLIDWLGEMVRLAVVKVDRAD